MKKIYRDDRGEFQVNKSSYHKDGISIHVREQEYRAGGPSRFKIKADFTLGFEESEQQHYERERLKYGPPLKEHIGFETADIMRGAMIAAIENHNLKMSQNTTNADN